MEEGEAAEAVGAGDELTAGVGQVDIQRRHIHVVVRRAIEQVYDCVHDHIIITRYATFGAAEDTFEPHGDRRVVAEADIDLLEVAEHALRLQRMRANLLYVAQVDLLLHVAVHHVSGEDAQQQHRDHHRNHEEHQVVQEEASSHVSNP